MNGQSGQLSTEVLADQLTLSRPEGADCALATLLLLAYAHPAVGSYFTDWCHLKRFSYYQIHECMKVCRSASVMKIFDPLVSFQPITKHLCIFS